MTRTTFQSIALAAFLVAPVPALAAAKGKAMTKPDFTKGDAIPAGATHDWNLGPTGLRGWIFCDKLVTTDARQIAITKVEKGSPAAGTFAVGDVLLGAGGKTFSFDPRTELGMAITAAETEAGGGKLVLTRWRAGASQQVVVKLPVLGTYSATAPYDCPKSRRIFEQGIKVLAARMAEPGYAKKQNPITRSLNALALLASRNPAHLPLVKAEAQWAAAFSTESFATWHYGYVMMLLSEYVMATGDQSVMPGLRRLALEAANGQSGVGSWGHKFARPNGLLNGYGMMNAPGVPLTISLILARKTGIKNPELDKAIALSTRLLRFYVGKGSVPYGDHHPWIQTHDDNGKNGMAAVMFNLMDDAVAAEFFSRMCVASHGAERDTGHTGNFFNLLWAMPGVSLSGPKASGAWMAEFGWYYDLARRWDGTFTHQGPPEPQPDKYKGWDATGAFLLAYAQPLRGTHLTGKQPSLAAKVDASGATGLIEDGRGWNQREKHAAYAQRSEEQLFAGLGSWSPVVRERSALSLAGRKGDPMPRLLKLLESADPPARLGACQAMAALGKRAAPGVPALRKTLHADDLWLRIQAADALAAIGDAAMVALPELLTLLAAENPATDPRGMQQRYLTFALFDRRDGLLKRSLDGVDREALYKAVRAGLHNDDGRARSTIGSIYAELSTEDIVPLLPAIHQAVVHPAPSGEMFADGVRLSGLDVLAKHRIAEGMPLCLEVMEIDRWGKANRITGCLKAFQGYGGAAKPLLPRLAQLETDLRAHPEAKSLQPHIKLLHETVLRIQADKNPPALRSLSSTR